MKAISMYRRRFHLNNQKFWTEGVAYLFILLFLYAAANKLLDYQKFTVQLGQSPLLTGYGQFIAWFIPGIEIIISGMLAFEFTRLIGLYASFSLMVMFTSYIIAILNFAKRVPCSCGGILDKLGWTEHLVFNAAFVLLAIAGIALHSKSNLKMIRRYPLANRNQGLPKTCNRVGV